MPKLSEYLLREAAAAAAAAGTVAAAPDQPGAQAAAAAAHQPAPPAPPARPDAFAAELAKLQRLYAARQQQHGARVYRQDDGTLSSQPPARDPFAVANRRKWRGLVAHCRQQPDVRPELDRTGLSALHSINTTFQQHAAAMSAVGLSPEVDEHGTWEGLQPAKSDPLEQEDHALRHGSWRGLTRAVLERAVNVHGSGILERSRLAF